MGGRNLSNVQTAFDMLSEAMSEEIRATNQAGGRALQSGEYDAARAAMYAQLSNSRCFGNGCRRCAMSGSGEILRCGSG